MPFRKVNLFWFGLVLLGAGAAWWLAAPRAAPKAAVQAATGAPSLRERADGVRRHAAAGFLAEAEDAARQVRKCSEKAAEACAALDRDGGAPRRRFADAESRLRGGCERGQAGACVHLGDLERLAGRKAEATRAYGRAHDVLTAAQSSCPGADPAGCARVARLMRALASRTGA